MTDEKSPKKLPEEMTAEIERIFEHFAPGGKFGPIEDPEEYEQLAASLPPAERELNKEMTNFARLLDFYERSNLKVNPSVADELFAIAKLPVEERLEPVRKINQRLMERLANAGESSSFRN
jgi:hypothetical protein